MNEDMMEIKSELARVTKVSLEYEKYLKEKAIRIRDWIIGILLFLLIASNVAWAIYESSMETVTETTETVTTTFENVDQTADNGGTNNIVGGDFVNGK